MGERRIAATTSLGKKGREKNWFERIRRQEQIFFKSVLMTYTIVPMDNCAYSILKSDLGALGSAMRGAEVRQCGGSLFCFRKTAAEEEMYI